MKPEPVASDPLLAVPDPARDVRRRIFLWVMPVAVLACLSALLVQAPHFDPLDCWALPTLNVVLLGVYLALRRPTAPVDELIGVAYAAVATYFLLALNHQFEVFVPNHNALSESTFWFAVLYAAAYAAWAPRKAFTFAGITWGLALLIGVLNLFALHADGALTVRVLGIMAQFYLSGAVLIGIQYALAFARKRDREVHLMAYMDFLTGLPNRRYAEGHLAQHTRPGHAPLSVVMLDLDHFKRINDTYGHHVGDHVLRELAQVLSRHTGRARVLARWGGEEFLLILPDTVLADAHALAERMRQSVEAHVFDEVGVATISAGVAQAEADEAAHAVLRRADAALYRAKGQGRNRVMADTEPRGGTRVSLPVTGD
ncbi:GGDEF domain-containing protein [Deinococcus maricopensis]|nr:GGDEF domain-containing protein [Deinococcus maricopensis]